MNALRHAFVVLLAAAALACTSNRPPPAAMCRHGMLCWPSDTQWQELAASLDGKLLRPESPLAPCRASYASPECVAALETLKNPYALQDDPGATQSLGWLDAWTAAPSLYAVAAESEKDVQAAVRFAHAHDIKLVIKGTGHDYLGRSSAPDSLLVWTHRMRRIKVSDAFVPEGCSPETPAKPALTAGAGARWLEAYKDAGSNGRYVQGGGCNSVGVAGGFLQGGGFGSWSNMYGMAAAGLLEARVVTADGEARVANACQNQDLFWALKGGGGGTYGVVTQVTLMTHPAPSHLGFVLGSIEARDATAYRELLERFFELYKGKLMRADWGEHIRVLGKNRIEVTMSFVGMSAAAAREIWTPFLDSLDTRFQKNLDFIAVPGRAMWSADFARMAASAVELDTRPAQDRQLFWWKSNQDEVATYWYAYTSRWLPEKLFDDPARIAQLLFDASRKWSVEVYFNKGQATVSEDARVRNRDTSVNPVVHASAALAIVAANGSGSPGVSGHEPDAARGAEERAAVHAAMDILRRATPRSGSYVNETDYFEPDWQDSFWGSNYERLLAIKRTYDADGVFRCHHCVGSE